MKSNFALLAAAALAGLSVAQNNTTLTIDPNSVDLGERLKWCKGQTNTCTAVCGGPGETKLNRCDEVSISRALGGCPLRCLLRFRARLTDSPFPRRKTSLMSALAATIPPPQLASTRIPSLSTSAKRPSRSASSSTRTTERARTNASAHSAARRTQPSSLPRPPLPPPPRPALRQRPALPREPRALLRPPHRPVQPSCSLPRATAPVPSPPVSSHSSALPSERRARTPPRQVNKRGR